ncbi:Aldehyde dehydrogenase B [Arcticibacter svalbardensis MN12-7]|uniref:aldehyde dehydrogenase (NAD(+)) n=1 Tax=Arcticibacter svalbardensis MN12-7 TaxID=1150600 RepID=R9GWG5_9SPHI|nr:aldehyde dehydrogenase family protein [Arcticibacter svalbardensis]EOR93279.1 Aldehyde dehydrogenase B [Arcticibacter svalbardensis MN12-7]
MNNIDFLKVLGLEDLNPGVSTGNDWILTANEIESISPVDGKRIGTVRIASPEDYESVIKTAEEAFPEWRKLPAPKRGDIIRQMADAFRKYKQELGTLISYEMGKSLQEGLGEVQEVIDVCDFASGLSRQIYGLTMHSERPDHRMYEQYHPLGIVGVITAFNFPAAVWAWNTMLALVCGDVAVWKPSHKVLLTAVACQKIAGRVLKENNVPEGVCSLICGANELGETMAKDKRIPLISATGSTAMGRKVAVAVGERLGKTLLELGGNNAIIITENADLTIALHASVFGAIGTAGQRCTTTRRLIIHSSIFEEFKIKLLNAYKQVKIGNPLLEGIHMGPLIDQSAVQHYLNALDDCKEQGAQFTVEGGVLEGTGYESGCYVKPCIVEVKPDFPIVQKETFAPLLYIMEYDTLAEAIGIQNGVSQGLSSGIISLNLRETELFLSSAGSDCGIANVNIGTSGAEIGGAFGGEKDSGGGRESGSDSWKAYMRRQTNTINYGTGLPLAQGIKFDF